MRPGLGMFLVGFALTAGCLVATFLTENGGIQLDSRTVLKVWPGIFVGLWFAIQGVMRVSRGSG